MSVDLDWEWATRTGGNLSPRESRQLVGVLFRDLPSAVAGMVRYRLGQRGTGSTDLVALPVPDSKLARRAEGFVRKELSAHVLAHSYRTYYFGKVLAAHESVTVDDEVVYLTSLLHDLRLEQPTPQRCFALTGAERTAELPAEWGAEDSIIWKVTAAACEHATPGVEHDLSNPAGFVLAGSLADIIGRRLNYVDPLWLEDLLRRYPRHGLKHHLVAALRAEAKAVPRGRMCLANRWASVPLLVRIAPYPD